MKVTVRCQQQLHERQRLYELLNSDPSFSWKLPRINTDDTDQIRVISVNLWQYLHHASHSSY